MGHNGLLKFPHHTSASTDTQDQELSWHLCPTDTQQHMVCNSDTSGAPAAAECGQSYELWIWANCFLIWKVLLFLACTAHGFKQVVWFDLHPVTILSFSMSFFIDSCLEKQSELYKANLTP